ncbi:MAG: helix-turn-helix domain-containing protein [Candidatus Thorarchaeota archaeon]
MSDTITENLPILKASLGVTDFEARVLLPVYMGGNMTAGGIALVLGDQLSKVDRALKKLVDKGLVRKSEGRVPIYHPISPAISLIDNLSALLEPLDKLSTTTSKSLDQNNMDLDKSVTDLIKSTKKITDDTRKTMDTYESQVLKAVQTQIDSVAEIANQVLVTFSQGVDTTLSALDTTLEENLGTELLTLQAELDKNQKTLQKELRAITRSLNKWLKDQALASNDGITSFDTKATTLLLRAKSIVADTLTQSEKVLKSSSATLSTSLSDKAQSVTDSASLSITSVTDTLTEALSKFDTELGQAHLEALESLQELMGRGREVSSEYAGVAKEVIEQAADRISTVGTDISSWKIEVAGFCENSSRTLNTQFEQLSSTDTAYLDAIKTSVTGHLERVNSILSSEYSALQTISSAITTDLETFLSDIRSAVLGVLQRQSDADQKSLDAAGEALGLELDLWVKSTAKNLNTKMSGVRDEVTGVLNTESTEFVTLAENMNSRLKSAYKSAMTSTNTRNDVVIAGFKRDTHDFEVSVGKKLKEAVSTFTSASEKHFDEVKTIYDSLAGGLDERVIESVSTLSSLADTIQKDIGSIINDQTARIDSHSQAIRDAFHNQLEDMTRQFITATQNLEATFNGLLSSQTIEARDLISSSHAEIRTALKSEMTSFQEESMKLQQDYTSDISMKVDEVGASVAALRKSLNEFTSEKHAEISESVAETLERVETGIISTNDALKEMESGTIEQIGASIVQISKEFETSVSAARDNISERMDGFNDETLDSLNSVTTGAQTAIESYIAEQQDSRQRNLTSTSKKIDTLASKTLKKTSEKIELYHTSLAKAETTGVRDRANAREEVISAIDSHKLEVGVAFDAASMSINTTVENISTSLESLGVKLDGEMVEVRDELQKQAANAEKRLMQRGESSLERLEQMTISLFQKSEATLKAHASEFGTTSAVALDKSQTRLNKIPATIAKTTTETINTARKELSQKFREIGASVADDTVAFEMSIKDAVEVYAALIEGTFNQVKTTRDKAFEDALSSVINANQQASRKFESIGLNLKTKFSNDSYQLIERLQGDVTVATQNVANTMTETTNAASESTSTTRVVRNESLNKTSVDIDKETRRWSKSQKKLNADLSNELQQTMKSISELTESTITSLNAVIEAGNAVMQTPSENSWYLSGQEEICAYILDMVQRAEKSAVISLPNIECFNLKALSRIKGPIRKVLIVPEMDDPPEILTSLKGWRIWYAKDPMMLAIADDAEIVLGGTEDSDAPMAIASIDESYIQLYHDVLGPQLTRSRIL